MFQDRILITNNERLFGRAQFIAVGIVVDLQVRDWWRVCWNMELLDFSWREERIGGKYTSIFTSLAKGRAPLWLSYR